MGRLADADASYRRALELKPDSAEAHSNPLFCMAQFGSALPGVEFNEHFEGGKRVAATHFGPLVREFENRLARHLSDDGVSPPAVCLSSAMASLDLCVAALDLCAVATVHPTDEAHLRELAAAHFPGCRGKTAGGHASLAGRHESFPRAGAGRSGSTRFDGVYVGNPARKTGRTALEVSGG